MKMVASLLFSFFMVFLIIPGEYLKKEMNVIESIEAIKLVNFHDWMFNILLLSILFGILSILIKLWSK